MHRAIRPILVADDASQSAAPSPLDIALRSLDRGRKRKPSAFLHEAFHCNREPTTRARPHARRASLAAPHRRQRAGMWACRGCNRPTIELILSDDKAAYSCLGAAYKIPEQLSK